MKTTELLRLVWLNIIQNKFKAVMTSIGIVVGAATIVMVIAIGRGGQMDVAEQFSSLNAGAIDISYEYEASEEAGGFLSDMSGMMEGIQSFFGGGGFSFGGGSGGSSDSQGGSAGGGMDFRMGGDFSGSFGGMGGGIPGGMGGGNTDAGDTGSGSGGGFPDFGNMGEMPEGMELPDQAGEEADAGGTDGQETGDSAEGKDGQEAGDSAEGKDGQDAGNSAEGKEGQEAGNSAAGDEEAEGGENAGESAEGDMAAAADSTAEAETETDITDERLNQEKIILTAEDAEDLEALVPGLDGVTISYSTRADAEGGSLTEAQTYTVAGVLSSYASVSNLQLAEGEFITDLDDENKARVCVLGASVARELFGSAQEAYEETLYLDDRAYTIVGVLESAGTVSANITLDEAIFIPYQTGVKYITGENISPVITVLSADLNAIDTVIANARTVLAAKYTTAEFTFSDSGSKMEAAESSNEILTMLLSAMAAIVFIVGGIGIMNVLFVSVRERTEEIGILKSLGASKKTILFEFLAESAAISLIGGCLGVAASFAVSPVVEYYGVRVEANALAWGAALLFSVLTGTIFGLYPAWKASKLVPVEALNAE